MWQEGRPVCKETECWYMLVMVILLELGAYDLHLFQSSGYHYHHIIGPLLQ